MKSSIESEDMKKNFDVGEWGKKKGMESSKAVGEWKDWEMRFYCSVALGSHLQFFLISRGPPWWDLFLLMFSAIWLQMWSRQKQSWILVELQLYPTIYSAVFSNKIQHRSYNTVCNPTCIFYHRAFWASLFLIQIGSLRDLKLKMSTPWPACVK